MHNEQLTNRRPLTNRMIECLMECHERELMKQQPCEVTEKGVKGLLSRQLVTTDFFVDPNGKRYVCVIVTDKGRNYLKKVV
jgi:hypothetical protein